MRGIEIIVKIYEFGIESREFRSCRANWLLARVESSLMMLFSDHRNDTQRLSGLSASVMQHYGIRAVEHPMKED